MAENRKRSAPSTSKQIESEKEDVYDVENYVKRRLTESGIKSDSTNEDKLVLLSSSF